jgi:DNA-damage-inducible protein J
VTYIPESPQAERVVLRSGRDASQALQDPSGIRHANELHYGSVERIFMASNALVQTRIDSDVRDRATAVLENMGLTVSDAVRILLTRTANEGALPLELLSNSAAHDAWFRAKVREALEDSRPDIPDSDADAQFAARRAAALRKAETGE